MYIYIYIYIYIIIIYPDIVKVPPIDLSSTTNYKNTVALNKKFP